MKVQAPFGFVTGCHAGDKFMVQATLASMRHYCPQVPICLTVDGDFDVSDLVRDYSVIPLRISELPSSEMRKLIGFNYRAKLAAMWEGPFERYVWLDSDAIVWGDFTPLVRRDLDFQIFGGDKPIPADATEIPAWLPHYYFNPEKLSLFDPCFEWRGHAYFSAGVYACRRNVISFNRWCEIEAWNDRTPGGLFQFGDMGSLNYLVHAMTQRGEIQSACSDLQHIPGHEAIQEFEQDRAGAGWQFPAHVKRPRVAHFCGRKPFLFDRNAYSKPFTIARLAHYRLHHSEKGAWLRIIGEDWRVLRGKLSRKCLRFAGKQVPTSLACA